MFCTACGSRNAEISNFCKQCGHKLDRAGAPRISEEAFDRALPLEEQVSALLERAYRLRKSGELSAAVRLCEEALRLNPESTSVHSLLGQIQEQTGNHAAAIHEYERVLQLNPGSIADRVKLDELRGDGLPAPLHPRTEPHIVMPNRTLPSPNGRQILGIAGTAGALMVIGGLLALQFFAHQDKNSTRSGAANVHNTGRDASSSAPSALNSSSGASVDPGSSVQANSVSPNAAIAANAGPGVSGLPANTTYGSQSYPPPNVYITPPRPIIIHDAPPVASSRNGGGLPNLANLHTQPVNDNGDERTHLDGSETPYNIVIRPPGDSADTAASGSGTTPSSSNNPASHKGAAALKGGAPEKVAVIPPRISVHKPTDSGSAGGGTAAPSTEAQSQIAIASDKFKNSDYDSAIKIYRRALGGAGSSTGYVYQQMGICFQRIKNKESAIANFHSAIAEYQKLESAHQQEDLARVGIKVCENGIKLCNAE